MQMNHHRRRTFRPCGIAHGAVFVGGYLERLTKPCHPQSPDERLGYVSRRKNKQISAALFKRIEPLLPVFIASAKGGRPRESDEMAVNGILFVLRTGIPWEELPQELGFGSGMTCWRRLRQWQDAGVWHQLHMLLLAEPRSAGRLDFSRASLDGASVPSPRGARTQVPILRTEANSAASVTSSQMPKASR